MKRLLIVVTALAAQSLAAQSDPRAKLLTNLGCSDCHAVVALHVKSKADVGPDLSAAYVDVPFRYGMTLERFFDQPASVMRLVLGGRPKLRRAEQDSLIALFRNLYNEHLARSDSAQHRLRVADGGHVTLFKED
ncbi:MAG TPA: hypothetical protein VL549_03900 [Gemmatimonadales bacterium]|jgi:hypothetical protein|nr:hypothetical protein [Gemmatimonadales bacterium]